MPRPAAAHPAEVLPQRRVLLEVRTGHWLPDHQDTTWKLFAELIESAGHNQVWSLTVTADEQLVRCVGHNLSESVNAEMEAMLQELVEAEGNLRSDAVANRLARCQEIQRNVANYERAFDQTLEDVRERMAQVQGLLATYTIARAAEDLRRSA